MMALLKRNIPLTTILLCIIAVIAIAIHSNFVDCRPTCGYVEPTIIIAENSTCYGTGITVSYVYRLIWNDGTYSDRSLNTTAQLVTGSCCGTFRNIFYDFGDVVGGRYLGEKVVQVYDLRDVRQTCSACQSNSGVSRLTGRILLSIGTKGVGNWIQCSGTGTVTYSPALSHNAQTVYTTHYLVYDKCYDSIEQC